MDSIIDPQTRGIVMKAYESYREGAVVNVHDIRVAASLDGASLEDVTSSAITAILRQLSADRSEDGKGWVVEHASDPVHNLARRYCLTHRQARILDIIRESPCSTEEAQAKATELTPPEVTVAIRTLKKRGLIHRVSSDRRYAPIWGVIG